MSRNISYSIIKLIVVLFLGQPCFGQADKDRPNVLFILVDDLKPAIGGFGDSVAITPNIDQLIKSGVRFDRAYTNQAVCVASRNSLLLGSRSTSIGIYNFGRAFRNHYPDVVTLPQAFKNEGYLTQAIGKVFHVGHGTYNDQQSWTEPHFHEKIIEYVSQQKTETELTREEALFENHPWAEASSLTRGRAWESPDVEDDAYGDGRVAIKAIQTLDSLKHLDKSFFLAVGFARPHLPFSVPKRYWDLYQESELPLPITEKHPEGAPRFAVKRSGEIEQYQGIPRYADEKRFPDSLKRKLIHGYYAAVSYVDAQIGKVLRSLKESGLEENTIVVLWGDHGFLLGDMGMWTKHVNYELANRIPLVISYPEKILSDHAVKSVTETVDIYPTLIELAGLPLPTDHPLPFDGESLVTRLTQKEHVEDYAYHCFPRDGWMGLAIRTDDYRLVEWKNIKDDSVPPQYEFYKYNEDLIEYKNLADANLADFQKVLNILQQQPAYLKPLSANNRPSNR